MIQEWRYNCGLAFEVMIPPLVAILLKESQIKTMDKNNCLQLLSELVFSHCFKMFQNTVNMVYFKKSVDLTVCTWW